MSTKTRRQMHPASSQNSDLPHLLRALGDNFIGLWRFRVYGEQRRWCVTLHVNGYYYDTKGKATAALALRDAIRTLDKIARKKAPAIRRPHFPK